MCDDLTLGDLKTLAREYGLKGYSKLRKDDLCDLVTKKIFKSTSAPTPKPKANPRKRKAVTCDNMTVKMLKKEASEKGVRGRSKMRKQELCDALYPQRKKKKPQPKKVVPKAGQEWIADPQPLGPYEWKPFKGGSAHAHRGKIKKDAQGKEWISLPTAFGTYEWKPFYGNNPGSRGIHGSKPKKVTFQEKPKKKDVAKIASDCAEGKKNWTVMKDNELGSGGYGTVYVACKGKDCTYAMKITKKLQEHHREVRAFQILKGKGVAPEMMGAWVCGKEGFIVMRQVQRRTPTEEQVMDKILQLHIAGIAHNDIHEGNTLMDEKGEAVIIDFGLCVFWNEPNYDRATLEDIIQVYELRGPGTRFVEYDNTRKLLDIMKRQRISLEKAEQERPIKWYNVERSVFRD